MVAEGESPELLDAIWEVELQYDLALYYPKFVAFMLDCLTLVRPHLPVIALEALVVARRFQAGQAELELLTAERVKCWNHLRERGHTSEFQDRETVAIRAAICTLYPERGNEETAGDLLAWFFMLLNRLEDRTAEALELLRRHFPLQET